MRWYGLTGGIASGKSTVAKILSDLGVPVVNADNLAHLALEPGFKSYDQVIKTFGQDILNKEKKIDRKKLGHIVFGDPKKLKILNSIVHPVVRQLTLQRRKELEKSGAKIAFYDVPLLFETKMEELFDSVVVVYCDEATQKKRLAKRSNLSKSEIQQRIKAQLPISEKVKRADFVIDNSKTETDLKENVFDFLEKISYKPQE